MIIRNITYYVCPRCQSPMILHGPLHVRCTYCMNNNGTPLIKLRTEVEVLTAEEIDNQPIETYLERLRELNKANQ